MSDPGIFDPDVYGALVRSWTRSLRARNRSPRTIESYVLAADQLATYARKHQRASRDRALLEDFLGDVASRRKPATVAQRYRSLQQFTKWLAEEEELPGDPMAKMRPPSVPVEPVPVLSVDQLKALLATCTGKTFVERRDQAVLRLLVDTGMRLGEISGLMVDDLDMGPDVAVVTGKGRKVRSCPFGAKTGQALDRYLREDGPGTGRCHRRP